MARIVRTTAYIKYRTSGNTLKKKAPYEIIFNKKPRVKYLRLFGSTTSMRVPEEKQASKWDKKADEDIMVGGGKRP